MSKTYKKDSRRNLYDPSWCTHNMRISVEQRFKIKKRVAELHITLAEFNRMIVSEAVKDVKLTSADLMEIAMQVKKNEENNEKRQRGEKV